MPRAEIRFGLIAGAVAAIPSGAPSTLWALARGADPLEAARAAGNLLLPASATPSALLVAGGVAHVVISLFWAVVLALVLPARHTLLWGAMGGLAIAALDLGIFGRAFPLIAALEPWPQIADHVAFGVVCALVIARLRRRTAGRLRAATDGRAGPRRSAGP